MFRIAKVIFLVVVLVGLPTALVFSVVNNNAKSQGSHELRLMARTYLERADIVLGTAVDRLRTLAQSDLNTCNRSHRHVFQEAARTGPFIHAVGMVDANGNVMCMEPDLAGYKRHLLKPTDLNDPMLTFEVVEMTNGRGNSVIASWRIENGIRLVVGTSPEAIALEAGPNWLRSARDLKLTVNDKDAWYSRGRISTPGSAAKDIKLVAVDAHSERFPVTVAARAPMDVILLQTDELDSFFLLTAIAVAVVILMIMIWNSFRRGDGLEDELNRAIRRREFIAYYQPVMNIETGQLAGCEALVRWRKRDGTIVPPGQFLPYAETSGHIYAMTRQLMRRVQSDLGELYDMRPDLKVSINLVASHFDNRRIIQDAEKYFGRDGGIGFENVVFEVTERLPLHDVQQARGIIKELQSHGMRVALDDAGTGHGGLAYIQQLGIDIIKIDKMFIDSIGKDRGSSAIVDLLVELAASLEMGVIAEGVEDIDQVEELREMGVTFAQGYIFSPPLPANQFLALAQALSTKSPKPQEPDDSAETDLDGDEIAAA